MKIITSAQLCSYPVRTVFRSFRPSVLSENKSFMTGEELGEFEVIIAKRDYGNGNGDTINQTGPLFDWDESENDQLYGLKLGDERPITNEGHSSCAGCFGSYCTDLYQVFDREDLRRAFARFLVPGIALTFEESIIASDADIGLIKRPQT